MIWSLSFGVKYLYTVLGMEFRTFHIPLISGSLLKHISGLRVPEDGHHYDNVKTHLQNENQCENV